MKAIEKKILHRISFSPGQADDDIVYYFENEEIAHKAYQEIYRQPYSSKKRICVFWLPEYESFIYDSLQFPIKDIRHETPDTTWRKKQEEEERKKKEAIQKLKAANLTEEEANILGIKEYK